MRRQVMDGLIIAAALLGATHLYGQVISRKVVRPNHAGMTSSALQGATGPNGGAAMDARGWRTDGQRTVRETVPHTK